MPYPNPDDWEAEERSGVAAATSPLIDDDLDPERAGKSIKLGQTLGLDPSVVYGDYDHWDRQARTMYTGALTGSNAELRDFARRHPIIPQLAADDWGKLDGLSEVLKKWHGIPGFIPGFKTMETAVDKFVEGFGSEPFGEWMPDRTEFEQALKRSLKKNLAFLALDIPAELALRGPNAVINALSGAAGATVDDQGKMITNAWNYIFSTQAGKAINKEWTRHFTQLPLTSFFQGSAGRDVSGMVEMELTGMGGGGMPHLSPGQIQKMQIGRMLEAAAPYAEAGKEIPLGVHPLWDKLKIKQLESDLKILKEMEDAAGQSALHERAPRQLQAFIDQHLQNGKISIPAEKILELYGEKAPTADDKILGWMPDLVDQMEAALLSGGDISIPLSGWLTHTDPEVAKGLRDFVRTRAEGVTKDEVRDIEANISRMIDAWHGSPHHFEAFDLGKIGTGEGAQAYGHGFYFAENPNVAQSYQPRGIEEYEVRPLGKKFIVTNKSGFWRGSGQIFETREEAQKVADADSVRPGAIYRVRIHAEKEHFLDWDKVEQHPYVQTILDQLGLKEHIPGGVDLGEFAGQKVQGAVQAGQAWYEAMATKLSKGEKGRKYKQDAEAASRALAEAGIPGIKYLDQGSRGRDQLREMAKASLEERTKEFEAEPEGPRKEGLAKEIEYFKNKVTEPETYNYVVFDPDLIQILDRNGQILETVKMAAGLPPHYGTGPRPGWKWTPAHEKVSVRGSKGTVDVVPMAITPLRQALGPQHIDVTLAPRPFQQIIMDRIKEVAGDVPVYVIKNVDFDKVIDGAAAYYHPMMTTEGKLLGYSDFIVVPSRTFYSSALNESIYHEAIHAATVRGMTVDRRLWDKGDAIIAEIRSFFSSPGVPHSLREAFSKDILPEYALTDARELLTVGLTNRNFHRILKEIPISDKLADLMQLKEKRPASLFDAFRMWLRQIWEGVMGRSPETHSALEAVLSLLEQTMEAREKIATEVARLHAPGDLAKPSAILGMPKKQGELPFETPMDQRVPFGTIPGWMSKAQQAKHLENVHRAWNADREWLMKQAKETVSERQREREKEVRAEVAQDFEARPDIMAIQFFRSGMLGGEKYGYPRVNPETMTPEQKALFPEKYQRRDGMAAADAANLLGFHSFDDLAQLMSQVEQSLTGKASTRDFINGLMKKEVDRRIAQEFGKTEDEILKEAQEHVVGQSTMDILTEETQALGMQLNQEVTLSKDDMKQQAALRFSQLLAEDVDESKFLRQSGKAARLVELGLLESTIKGEGKGAIEALKAKQEQLQSLLLANEAKKFEKEHDQFYRFFRRFSKRYVQGIDQQILNHIQKLLSDVAGQTARSPGELQEAIARSDYPTLQALVDGLVEDGYGQALTVDQDVIEGKIPTLDKMTVQQFREFHESLQSLAHVGALAQWVFISGEKRKFEDFKAQVRAQIRTMPLRKETINALYKMDAWLTRPEEIIKDLDLRKELGPLYKGVIEPLVEAKHDKMKMEEDLTKRLKQIKGANKDWMKRLDEDVPNDFFEDPRDRTLFNMTRKDMIGLMLNWGNVENIRKVVLGYLKDMEGNELNGGDPVAFFNKLDSWIMKNATKEDWQFVQNMWDVWKPWKDKYNDLFYELGGTPPRWIPARVVDTPHGRFDGGYWPLMMDPLRGKRAGVEPEVGKFQPPLIYPLASGLKERTGAVYPVDFRRSIDRVGLRMQQTMHDLAYRKALMQASKILLDKDISNDIKNHYGKEYQDQFEPWLEHIANQFKINESEDAGATSWLRRTRMALMVQVLGINPRVFLSPLTGRTNPMDMVRFGMPWMNRKNTDFILSKSRELEHTYKNINRDYREALEGAITGGRMDQWQATSVEWAFKWTVLSEQYFRKVTFYNKYMEAKARGLSEGDAISVADSAVREWHGTGAVSDLSRVMRSSEGMKMATMFYGYGNTLYNQRRQMVGTLRRGEYLKAFQQFMMYWAVPMGFSMALYNKLTQSDSMWSFLGNSILLEAGVHIPWLRDIMNLAVEGYESRTPWGSVIQTAGSGAKDIYKLLTGKKHNKATQHIMNMIGITSGMLGLPLPTGAPARAIQFFTDWETDPSKAPKDIIETWRGINTGAAQLPKR